MGCCAHTSGKEGRKGKKKWVWTTFLHLLNYAGLVQLDSRTKPYSRVVKITSLGSLYWTSLTGGKCSFSDSSVVIYGGNLPAEKSHSKIKHCLIKFLGQLVKISKIWLLEPLSNLDFITNVEDLKQQPWALVHTFFYNWVTCPHKEILAQWTFVERQRWAMEITATPGEWHLSF